MIFSNHQIPALPLPASSSLPTSTFILSNDHDNHHHHHHPSMMRQSMSFHGGVTDHGIHTVYGGSGGAGDGDLSDDGSQMLGEKKKKRLSMEQVKALERSFETGNKLEHERKAQLARSLGMHPRQVAIWFQNRRAVDEQRAFWQWTVASDQHHLHD